MEHSTERWRPCRRSPRDPRETALSPREREREARPELTSSEHVAAAATRLQSALPVAPRHYLRRARRRRRLIRSGSRRRTCGRTRAVGDGDVRVARRGVERRVRHLQLQGGSGSRRRPSTPARPRTRRPPPSSGQGNCTTHTVHHHQWHSMPNAHIQCSMLTSGRALC